jgi:hypothetical protein
MHTDLMIDLETLSTAPNAVLLTLGAVAFTPGIEQYTSFSLVFDLQEQSKQNRHIDPETILWWLKQSEEAKNNLIQNEKLKSQDVHHRLVEFMTKYLVPKFRIWSYGASADIVWLKSYFKDFDLSDLWSYKQEYCMRTLCALIDPDSNLRVKPTVAHNALEDALAQAKTVAANLNKLSSFT